MTSVIGGVRKGLAEFHQSWSARISTAYAPNNEVEKSLQSRSATGAPIFAPVFGFIFWNFKTSFPQVLLKEVKITNCRLLANATEWTNSEPGVFGSLNGEMVFGPPIWVKLLSF
jgi:hypothetical protein